MTYTPAKKRQLAAALRARQGKKPRIHAYSTDSGESINTTAEGVTESVICIHSPSFNTIRLAPPINAHSTPPPLQTVFRADDYISQPHLDASASRDGTSIVDDLDGPNAAASDWVKKQFHRHRSTPEHVVM